MDKNGVFDNLDFTKEFTNWLTCYTDYYNLKLIYRCFIKFQQNTIIIYIII